LLAECATDPSDGSGFPCRCSDELASPSAGSAIGQMLADYQVMRDQARVCERFGE
jgi:hypothetical protein